MLLSKNAIESNLKPWEVNGFRTKPVNGEKFWNVRKTAEDDCDLEVDA